MPRAESFWRKVLVTQRKISSTVPQVKLMSAKFKKSGLRKKSTGGAGSPEQQQCIICLDTDELIERDKLLCGHSFHRRCINRWLGTSDSCPICRKPVYQPPQSHETVNILQQLQLNQVSQPQRSRGPSPQPQMPREQRRLQIQGLQLNPSGVQTHQQLFTTQSGTTHEQQANTARVQTQRHSFHKSDVVYTSLLLTLETQQRPLFPQIKKLQEEVKKLQEDIKKRHEATKELREEIKNLKELKFKKFEFEEQLKFRDERVRFLEEQKKFPDL